VLPGAKVYQNKNLPTESYLRHHPNPQMRAPVLHEYGYVDTTMKQKVADSVLQRVVGNGEVANGPKVRILCFFLCCFCPVIFHFNDCLFCCLMDDLIDLSLLSIFLRSCF
jgi:hypothetical protein